MRVANIGWSFTGLLAPLAAAAVTIPQLLAVIGQERFGLLALSWGLLGFASVFDLGFGRAATQTLSACLGSGQQEKISPLVSLATKYSLLSGAIGSGLMCAAVAAGAHLAINFDRTLLTEVTASAYVLAFVVPVQAISAMLRGINEAFDNFKAVSVIRIALGASNFLGPLLVSQYSSNLALLVLSLLATRILGAICFWYYAQRCLASKGLRKTQASNDDFSWARSRLLRFGGWFTVSSIASPVMVQADRFFIGALMSAAAVTSYAVPYEVVTQCLIFSNAVATVAFPSFTRTLHTDRGGALQMFRFWLLVLGTFMLLATSAVALALPVALPAWIGAALPNEAVLIGQVLCIGVFMNGIGSMLFAIVHANGRADLTAKFHLLELPVFLGFLYFAIVQWGALGAAIAWSARMALDTTLLGLASIHLARIQP